MELATWDKSGRFCIETNWGNIADAIFTELILACPVRSLRSDQWHVAPGPLRNLPGTQLVHQQDHHTSGEWILGFLPAGFAKVEHSGTRREVTVRVAAQSDFDARRIMAQIRAAIPAVTPPDPSVRVTFWTLGDGCPHSVEKDMGAPSWADIERNYPAATVAALTPLLVDTWRPQAGRLLLWHGDPGTGKTHAVRALLRAWKRWCSFHVVLDPEKFFGSDAQYMVNVLLREDADDDDTHADGNRDARWRLLILEDTGELLSIDARDRAGQGLSRLLNLCDGLLGQSLNVLVLITTNEDFGRLHPAVVRPGRCLSNVSFSRFDGAEACRWLLAHGITDVERTMSAMSLADLYARLDGRCIPDRAAAVGFLPG